MKKLIFFSTITMFLFAGLSITWSNVITLHNNFDIVSDAITGIQKTLDEQGSPYFIRRTYNIEKDKISIKTKGHYKEYRKKNFYDEDLINVSNSKNHGDVIEFVYKSSNKHQITRINKKTKKDVPKRQKIEFNFEPNSSQDLNIINIFTQLVAA